VSRRERIVVKIGGAALEEAGPRAAFARAVARAREDGSEVVVVHGGGNQVGRLSTRLGLETKRVAGLRVTDAATSEVVLQVLGGEVARKLAAALVEAGVPALSVTGADAGLFRARRLRHEQADLGYVGEVEHVDAVVLERLVAAGFVPLVASVAPDAHAVDGDDHFLNINADHAVAPLAAAWGADVVLFLSDVPGVLDAAKQRLAALSPAACQKLTAAGVISGGMLPKVDAALAAATANPRAVVKIALADGDDAVRSALRDDVGTRFHPEVPMPEAQVVTAAQPAAAPAAAAAPAPLAAAAAAPAAATAALPTVGNAGFFPTYKRAAPVFVRGSGSWLEDETGRRWLDLLSGIGCAALGHAHPRLVAALSAQLAKLSHTSNLFRHSEGEELALRLTAKAGMDTVFFCNSGTEANECALKLARKYQRERATATGTPPRTHFVALQHGFHGRTMGSVSITANPAYREPFAPTLEMELVAPDDVAALEAALMRKPAALVIEPIQGEGGVRPLSDEFLRAARRLCDTTDTVLVHDEIQCGFGRTGTFLAADAIGVKPDVVTLAKPMAGGFPMGAALARGKFASVLQPGNHGTTFGGNPLACRAALVMLDELENGLSENIAARGAQFAAGLDALVQKYPTIVTQRRGRGLQQGLVVPGKAAAVQAAMFEAGVIIATAAGDTLRFLPPYVVTADDIALGLQRLDSVLASS
jgi:acetylornithine/N-succinyldiaminopimelate aminotransferase